MRTIDLGSESGTLLKSPSIMRLKLNTTSWSYCGLSGNRGKLLWACFTEGLPPFTMYIISILQKYNKESCTGKKHIQMYLVITLVITTHCKQKDGHRVARE